jgi:hypothetical protein
MGTTANLDLPYPEPTDRARNGSVAIRALAEAVEDRTYSGSTVAQIELANSGVATGSFATFPGTQTLLVGFTYAAGVLTYSGPDRTFMVAATVEVVTAGTDLSSASSTVTLRRNGVNQVATHDQVDSVDSAGTIQRREVVHTLTLPLSLTAGDQIDVLAAAVPAATVGVTSIRVYPIGPALS